jgi:hypothetical protein
VGFLYTLPSIPYCQEHAVGTSSERTRELRRRRKRHQKLQVIARKAAKASASEKAHLAQKVRRMTTGAEIIIERLKLEAQR